MTGRPNLGTHQVRLTEQEATTYPAYRWGILTERALPQADSVDLITEAMKGYQ